MTRSNLGDEPHTGCNYAAGMESNWLLTAAEALAAPAGVAFLFWFGIRAVLRADQTERAAIARMEAEERARTHPDVAQDAGATG